MKRAFPEAKNLLKSGDLVVQWKTGLSDSSDSGKTVLAYEKKASREGGEVLMQDGTIKTMTAEEFKAAPKAGPG